MKTPVIDVSHIDKSFGSLKAVNDLGFSVWPSTCFGFLGPNGAGKTTMMEILYGKSVRDERDTCTIRVFGFDPRHNELDIKYISGVVSQENNLDEELNVVQNLQVYARFYGMKNPDAQKRIHELLEFFELSEKRKAKIRELSGGMKRRLVIARALLHIPKLLILDEPTTGLDPQVRHLIWEKLRQLKKKGLTILLTTHYMEEAFQLCDTILIMDRGRKIIEGAPAVLLRENIEPFVLEIHHDSMIKRMKDADRLSGIRLDNAHDRPLFYSHQFESLKTIADRLTPDQYYLRQSNLEDLFLKLTGRELNADQ